MELSENIFDNFESVDLVSNHYKEYLGRHLPGTCQWVFNHDSYREWENESGRALCLIGPPGVGKSILASVVTDRLMNKGWIVASLFCEKEDTHAPEVLVAQILQRAAEQVDPQDHQVVLSELGSLRRGFPDGPGEFRPHADLNAIVRHIANYVDGQRIGLIIDALDLVDSKRLQRLLTASRMLLEEFEVNVLVTTRYVGDSMRIIQPNASILIRATFEDLMRYATTYLFALRRPRHQDRELLCEWIIGASQGVFSFAVGLVFRLSTIQSQKKSWQVLTSWEEGRDLESVDRLLDSTIGKGDENFFMVIHWVAYTSQQLTMLELQHALSCEPDRESLPLLSPEQILALGDGLVEVDKETGRVGFFHPIVEKYVRQLPSPMPNVAWYFHDKIASACTICLAQAADVAKPGRRKHRHKTCLDADKFEELVRQKPFLEYAVRKWSLHAKECPVECDGINLLLDDRLAARMLSQAILVMDNNMPEAPEDKVKLIGTFSLLHMAAYLGLGDLVSHLVARGVPVNKMDSSGRTPLLWAALYNSEDAIRVLCKHDTITLPLLIGQEETTLTTLLVDSGYRINTTNALRRTPLHLAIMTQLPGVIATLVKAKADVNVRDINGVSPLMLALQLGDRSTVDLLLTNNADARALDFNAFRLMLLAEPNETIGIFQDREGSDYCLRRTSNQETLEAVLSRLGRCAIRTQDTGSTRLHFSTTEDWIREPFTPDFYLTLKSAENSTSDRDGGSWNYFSQITIPFTFDSNQSYQRIDVCWKVMYAPDRKGLHYWKTTAHLCNLPHLWLPQNGSEFFKHFIYYIRERWVSSCSEAIRRLNVQRRARVLRSKGGEPELLDTLLNDGQRWTSQRMALRQAISKAQSFAISYCERHDEGEYLEEVLKAIEQLSAEVCNILDQLDGISRDLIQLEFNLVSIKEARQSVTMSASMKRLTWITFIFLPLTFVATCFGMNIDILASNPIWWIYLPFATGTVVLTSTVWIIFKYSNLEQFIEDTVRSVFSRKKGIETSAGSTV